MNTNNLVQLKNITILIVEDDVILLENLKLTLEPLCKEIYTATSAATGVKFFNEKNIDLIITDYIMPIMDGFAFSKEVRKVDELIPIIIISNSTDTDKLLNVIPINHVEYIVKPIKYEKLISVLNNILSRSINEELFQIQITDEVQYNKLSKTLYKNSEDIKLTKSDIILIELFLKNRNNLVTDTMIQDALDFDDLRNYNAIKNTIYRLRKKIGKDILVNVQSLGYLMKNI